VGIEPQERDTAVARGQTFYRADMRAAAAAEDDRAVRELARQGEALPCERVLVDDGRLRIGQWQVCRVSHGFAVFPPGSRNADDGRRKAPAARVALVVAAQRDGSVRAAVRTDGAKTRHQIAFS